MHFFKFSVICNIQIIKLIDLFFSFYLFFFFFKDTYLINSLNNKKIHVISSIVLALRNRAVCRCTVPLNTSEMISEGWRTHPTQSSKDRRRQFNHREPSTRGFRILSMRRLQRSRHHLILDAVDRRGHATPCTLQRVGHCHAIRGNANLVTRLFRWS